MPGVSSSSLVWPLGWAGRFGTASAGLPLFDNCIGRKRNVDGGVLAVRWKTDVMLSGMGKRTFPTVTFPEFIVLDGLTTV